MLFVATAFLLSAFLLSACKPQPPHWENVCVKSHYDTTTTIRYDTAKKKTVTEKKRKKVCDQKERQCIKDERYKGTENWCQ